MYCASLLAIIKLEHEFLARPRMTHPLTSVRFYAYNRQHNDVILAGVLLFVLLTTYLRGYIYIRSVCKAINYKRYFEKWGVPRRGDRMKYRLLASFRGQTRLFTGEPMNYLMRKLCNVNKSAKFIGCHVFSVLPGNRDAPSRTDKGRF